MNRRRHAVAVWIRHKLPWLSDILDAYPFEFGLSLALMLFGMRALLSGLTAAPGSVQQLPLPLAIAYCVLSVLGGGAVLFGLLFKYRYAWSYGIERAGLFVSASAWGSYIVGLVFSPITTKSTLLIGALLALSIACILRARAIAKNVHAISYALGTMQSPRGE